MLPLTILGERKGMVTNEKLLLFLKLVNNILFCKTLLALLHPCSQDTTGYFFDQSLQFFYRNITATIISSITLYRLTLYVICYDFEESSQLRQMCTDLAAALSYKLRLLLTAYSLGRYIIIFVYRYRNKKEIPMQGLVRAKKVLEQSNNSYSSTRLARWLCN